MSFQIPDKFLVFALLATFVASCILALIATHRVRHIAHKLGIVDVPDGQRRLHSGPIPRIGGVAVYITVATVMLIALITVPSVTALLDHKRVFFALIFGSTAVFALGLLDDMIALPAWFKFLGEAAIAALMFAAGIRIESFYLPFLGQLSFSMPFSLLLTMLWIVGITNAFNLIDGSDGVAAGAALFSSASLAVVSMIGGNFLGAIAALGIAGATLGFLVFNFPPASVFLGDCGSLFLGFTLATLGVVSTQTSATALAVAIPVVSFGLPILDTSLTLVRRFLRGEPLFLADRGHIHHRLRDLGHSPRRVALLMYAVCAGFAMLSLLLVHPNGAVTATIFAVAGAVVLLGVQRLDIPELLEVRRVLHRGLQQRVAIGSSLRMREAAARIRRAGTPAQFAHELRASLEGRVFTRAELLVTADIGQELSAGMAMVRRANGFTWTWENQFAQLAHRVVEVRVPLYDGSRELGVLSLWLSLQAEAVSSDLRVVTLELQPALEQSILRLSTHPPHPIAAPVPVRQGLA